MQSWLLTTPPTSYEYDQAGNLTSVQRGGQAPAIDETYAYDGSGLRASQTVSGATGHLTWDTSAGLPLLLDDGQRSYVYGPGGMPIEQISAGTPTYLHHDQLGSTRVLTNGAGKVVGRFSYGAYGATAGSTGTKSTPHGYAGQNSSVQSGLQYLRARIYDPATSQFLTVDPLVQLTYAPYAYAGDNPNTFIDPSGKSKQACAGITGSFFITLEFRSMLLEHTWRIRDSYNRRGKRWSRHWSKYTCRSRGQ